MTRQMEHPEYSKSKLSNWIRDNPALDSKKGYCVTDLDYIINNYKTDKIMIIEEKCRKQEMTRSQKHILSIIDSSLKQTHPDTYYGTHLIQLENESPKDGKIFWDGEEITEKELTKKMRFGKSLSSSSSDDWLAV